MPTFVVSHLATDFFRLSLDLLFPKRCLGCLKEGAWVCSLCFQQFPHGYRRECFFCDRPSSDGRCCFFCSQQSPLDGVLVSVSYENIFFREAIHALKYHGVQELAAPISSVLCSALGIFLSSFSGDRSLIRCVPVPLASVRMQERGFNQAALLAARVAEQYSFPLVSAITRIHFVKPQVELSRTERMTGIRNAFSLVHGAPLDGTIILLVDDVVTTGATLNACAAILKKGGAKEVWGLALAYG